MHALRRHAAVAAALVAIAAAPLAACGEQSGGGPAAQGPPQIAGLVWHVSEAGEGAWSVYLVGTDGLASDYDRAVVTITSDTAWWSDDGASVDPPPFDASLVGRRVAVTFTGPVAESYPVQATAASVTLLDPGPPALVEPAGAPQFTGTVRETIVDEGGRVVEFVVVDADLRDTADDGATTRVRVDDRTTWLLDTPSGLVGTPDAPLVGNGLEPVVDVRFRDGVADWVRMYLASPTRKAE